MNMNTFKNKTTLIMAMIFIILGAFSMASASQDPQVEIPEVRVYDDSGKFEIGIYYGRWTVNPIIGALEDPLTEGLGEEIRDAITNELRGLGYPVVPGGYEEEFTFDSGGPNYGIEFRYYPRGRSGSFSLGLAIEKVTMRIEAEGNVRQDYQENTTAQADGTGEIELRPLFTILNFRWDFGPTWRVTPYYVMGLGVAALNMDDIDKNYVSYEYSGSYSGFGQSESVEGGDTLTLQDAEDEGSTNIPNILPLLQIGLGVRATITPNLSLKGEVNFWDGLVYRFGISGRF